MGISATYCEDISDVEEIPGAFEYYVAEVGGDPIGMVFNCPWGCGETNSVSFRPWKNRPVWTWDGNRESPTLKPSLHRIIDDKTHWHGYLTDGEWVSC